MNIRQYTQRAESPVINSVGQRPANRSRSLSQALKGRNQQDYAPLGLREGVGFVPMIGRYPILMIMPIQGNKNKLLGKNTDNHKK